MAHRKFKGPDGEGWEVCPESRNRWKLQPLPGNDAIPKFAQAPSYTDDPFELSEQELHKMLAGAQPSQGTARKPSPFRDLEEEREEAGE